MTCPTCSRSTRDHVNSSGLLTRCDDVWHQIEWSTESLAQPLPRHWLAGLVDDATHRPESLSSRGPAPEAASPVRPDDFATQTPPAPHFPPPSHHGAPERAYDASKDSHFPYTTPVPEPTANGANGWIYCNACDAPQPTSGHECAVWTEAEAAGLQRAAKVAAQIGRNAFGMYRREKDRAEFAESLLCAMAFDHGVMLEAAEYFDDCEPREDPRVDWICDDSSTGGEPERICVFCDAARGGGR